MPLAFVVGIVVSLVFPEPEADARFDEAEARMHLGA
jgi:cation/acetate symporter